MRKYLNGKVFGAVTGKDISDVAKKQYELDLDKRKVVIKEPIKALGTFEVPNDISHDEQDQMQK